MEHTPAPPTRRRFLRHAARAGVATLAAGVLTAEYGLWEAASICVRRQAVAVPHLPPPFAGVTVGVLADFHHGPFVGLTFVRRAVALANTLGADLFALVGDFAHRRTHTAEQLPPCVAEAAARSACSPSPATTTCSTAAKSTATPSATRRSPT